MQFVLISERQIPLYLQNVLWIFMQTCEMQINTFCVSFSSVDPLHSGHNLKFGVMGDLYLMVRNPPHLTVHGQKMGALFHSLSIQGMFKCYL